MDGSAPVIDGMPSGEASAASSSPQELIKFSAAAQDGRSREEACQPSLLQHNSVGNEPTIVIQQPEEVSPASSLQEIDHKCSVFRLCKPQKLLRPQSRRHPSSILGYASNQNDIRPPQSSANAKQRSASNKQEICSPSGILISGNDGEGNTPCGVGVLPGHNKKPLRIFESLTFNPFSSKFNVRKTAKYFKATGHQGIFGVPLRESITYANVAISLVDSEGKSYIYGYVPIVVAKCGVYLKEKGACRCLYRAREAANMCQATNVEGIFRLSGSEKRIKELRAIFDSPERYGKGLDWAGYTVHDAANVLRRYLNLLPEPIVPLNLYERFRDPLRGHTKQAVGDNEGPQLEEGFDVGKAIVTYQELITELPPLNRQLLLYILDLLAVFASKSDENRMNSQNLAAIFQPGMLSHPLHDMAPAEYRLSQDVLIFLIENQDHFLIGMRGTAADEKTVQEVQSGATSPGTPATPGKQRNSVARSSSNASAGAESVRKFGGVRRNVSVSSRQSRQSNGGLSPSTPTYGGTLSASGGLHRSNTVPSKKSPGLPHGRMQKNSGPPSPAPIGVSPQQPAASNDMSSVAPAAAPELLASLGAVPAAASSILAPSSHAASAVTSQERLLGDQLEKQPEVATPSKERNLTSFFQRSPTGETEKSEKRPPNKLRKKRVTSSNPSAQSSTNSLHGQQSSGVSPGLRPDRDAEDIEEHPKLEAIHSMSPVLSSTAVVDTTVAGAELTSPTMETPRAEQSHFPAQSGYTPPRDQTLKPKESPVSSIHSRSSFNDPSDLDRIDDPATAVEQKEKRSRWRLSRRKDDLRGNTLSPQRALGSDAGAGTSTSSVGSSAHPRKSFTGDTVPVGPDSNLVSTHLQSSNESNPGHTAPSGDERKGPLGWIKSKMREKREEREAEKERTKSPPASTERLAGRGKSMDIKREENPEKFAQEPPVLHAEPGPQ